MAEMGQKRHPCGLALPSAALALVLGVGRARAADETAGRVTAPAPTEEIIDDPLAKSPSPGRSHAEETLDDPTSRSPSKTPAPEASKIWNGILISRAAFQTSWDDLPGGPKDVFEWRTRALLSASDTPSRRLKWVLGVRFDAFTHAPKSTEGLLAEPSWRFDPRPWEAYLDVALGDVWRLKVGHQIVSWGRLDLGSAGDMLGTYDLRQGPNVGMDEIRSPTPTAVVTWTPVESLAVNVGYTPFFTPHRFDVAGSNTALVGPNTPGAFFPSLAALKNALDPASYVLLTNDLARINAPSARPDNGEIAGRASFRAGAFDLGLGYGFLRSKFPAIDVHPALAGALSSTSPDLAQVAQLAAAVERSEPLVQARYERYHQLVLDLEAPAGRVTFASELGYSPSRTLYARDPLTGLPVAVSSAVVQTGARATYLAGEDFALSAEVSLYVIPERPPSPYVVLGDQRSLLVGFVAVHKEAGPHVFEGALIATSSGPSLSFVPRYGFRLSEPLVVGVGGAAFFGSRSDPTSLAAIQRGLDQVMAYFDLRL